MEVSEDNMDGGENPVSPPSSVGFKELFRFADRLDYVLMAIGTVGAIVHGCSLPLFLRFFADLVNSFGSNADNIDKMTQEVVKKAFDASLLDVMAMIPSLFRLRLMNSEVRKSVAKMKSNVPSGTELCQFAFDLEIM
ncbi:hypothetical protein NE237_006607 [Protea cynaroides]|uniref:ABC transmembrane type-1 domain-containing protein n=1 Tax=Protea cynaroides TaxID=273540 RepID=A0A9Q0KMP7_9MAGN|nr:hypothetical protein NE237_006607 [Protea cynaroides]